MFGSDADRLARFEREAHLLASLNHPNIAQIYGLDDSTGQVALIMELVDGEDLAKLLSDGPLPTDQALAFAGQIIEALEAAHEQGIVHRDLKPANIKVREDGTIKVLDFGLAKASSPAVTTGADVTTIASTHAGVILGTAAYMAPERLPPERR